MDLEEYLFDSNKLVSEVDPISTDIKAEFYKNGVKKMKVENNSNNEEILVEEEEDILKVETKSETCDLKQENNLIVI